MTDALAKILRQGAGIDQRSVQQFWIQVRHDAARAKRFALLGNHAHRAAAFDQDLPHRARDANFHAALGRGFRHRLGDGAHSADRMSPGSLLAVDLAKYVVQQHIGRSGGIGARIVADHAVKSVGRLDRGALEPGVEIVSGRLDEQIQKLAPHRQIQFRDALALARAAQQFRQRRKPSAGRDVRRRLQHQIAQHVGDDVQPFAIRRQALRIARRELCDLLCGYARADLQIAGLVQRQEVGQLAFDDAQTMTRQVQIPNDLRIEQRHRVGRHGIAKARMKLLGNGGTADDGAPLEDGNLEPRGRKIGGADQPIVAAADNDGVAHRFQPPAVRQPGGGAVCRRLSGMSSRNRRAKLRSETSLCPRGPGV